eukprot:Gb_14666 [translate_table: standard]
MGGESNEEIIKEFEKITKDAQRVQEETLKAILQRNAGTEYLQKYGLNGRTDVESFKSCVPLVTHADIFPWIQRIADGDSSPILTADPIPELSLRLCTLGFTDWEPVIACKQYIHDRISSGTSDGRPKYIPFNQDLLDSTVQMFRLAAAYRARAFPTKPGGRILEFIYSGKQFHTKGGLVAGTATTNYFRSEHFKQKQRSTKAFTCSPEEVILGSDSQQSMYCHLLCGLLYSNEVEFVTSTFAYSIVEAFRMLEQVWEELCNDIKEGTLSQRITIPSMREAMSKILVSNPELAEAIHEKTSKLENWHGVIEQLWPNAKYVYSIMTGAMEPYLKKLRHYAGSLPLLSADYGATECWIGVNLNPRCPPQTTTFTVVPNFAFFEFIPLSRHLEDWQVDGTIEISHSRELQPVGLTEVKVGQEYEVVFTTFAGIRFLQVESYPELDAQNAQNRSMLVEQMGLYILVLDIGWKIANLKRTEPVWKLGPAAATVKQRLELHRPKRGLDEREHMKALHFDVIVLSDNLDEWELELAPHKYRHINAMITRYSQDAFVTNSQQFSVCRIISRVEVKAWVQVPPVSLHNVRPMSLENQIEVSWKSITLSTGASFGPLQFTLGLYRYKLGDVVKVTGFYNSSPQLAFVCRRNLILTVNIDKNTEKDLQMVVDKASHPLREERVELVDFTSYVDRSTEPGHYVIFWELSGGVNGEVLKKCCSIIDESFVDPGYVGSRKIKTIGPLELRIVERGTFRKILNHYLTLGATVSQFKTPRCIRSSQVVLDILDSGVIQKYFSAAFP